MKSKVQALEFFFFFCYVSIPILLEMMTLEGVEWVRSVEAIVTLDNPSNPLKIN